MLRQWQQGKVERERERDSKFRVLFHPAVIPLPSMQQLTKMANAQLCTFLVLGLLHGTSLFIDTHGILGNHAQKQNEWLLLWPCFFTISNVSHTMSAIQFSTNVQDCHNMSKLYLVHRMPLGLHGILLVVLSIQVPVVPTYHGTTWYIPGISHYLASPYQYQLPTYHGTTWYIPGIPHYLTPHCQFQVQKQKQLRHKQSKMLSVQNRQEQRLAIYMLIRLKK